MNTARAGMVGAPPTLQQASGNPEALKYGQLWEHPEYRISAPGELFAHVFLEQARPAPGATVIDFGCGTGRGGLMLALLGKMRVQFVDFVRNCLDSGVREAIAANPSELSFHKLDLEKPLPFASQYGYCTDVLEHIPPDKVDRVLDNILRAAQHVFLSIANFDDHCGGLIGETLHLSVHPFAWWQQKLLDREARILWSRETERHSLFYVTAWTTGESIMESGRLNVEVEQIRANVAHNIAQGYQQAIPHGANDFECLILGGGPSLNKAEADIRKRRREGAKLITLNGSYNWCVERNLLHEALLPSAQIIVDAREFNKRFTRPVVPTCKYLLASQCHPAVFEGIPKEQIYLWHASPSDIKDLLEARYGTQWFSIPGGSSVLLRAIPLLRMLGYGKFHLYGCDSCVADGQHHAFSQPENDAGIVLPVTLSDGRMFYAHPWMISQAHEFIQLIRKMGDTFDLEVHGDGLLRHILVTGAQLPDPDVKEE